MLYLAEEALVLRLLTQLVTGLEHGRADALLHAGMDPDQLAQLRALSLPDLRSLAASTTPVVSLAIDPAALARSLRALAHRKEFLRLRDEFIAHGAPPVLMRTLFSLRDKATFARRRELKVRRGRGRPQLPSQAIREAIETRWCAIREPDLRRRYLTLRDAFPDISLDALHVVVSAYEAMVNERAIPPVHRRRPLRVRDARYRARSVRRFRTASNRGV